MPIKYDLTDRRFGRLTVIGLAKRPTNLKSTSSVWQCRCDCGNDKLVRGDYLRQGLIKGCGCLIGEKQTGDPRYIGDLSYSYFSRLRSSARQRGISFEVSMLDLWNLFVAQDAYCAISGLRISLDKHLDRKGHIGQNASLDRVDSMKGYTKDNIQWVDKDVNMMKSDMKQDDFVSLIHLISDHLKSQS